VGVVGYTLGGGGNFGVVTALEFRLYPVDSLNAGWLVWPWEETRRVLGRWSEWVETVPEEVTSIGRILQVPPLPDLPEAIRGRQLVVVEAAILADEAKADGLLTPLRELSPELDTFAQVPAAALSGLHMDPPEPVPAAAHGSVIDALPREAVDALVDVAGPGSGSSLITVELRHIGGAIKRAPRRGGPRPHRRPLPGLRGRHRDDSGGGEGCRRGGGAGEHGRVGVGLGAVLLQLRRRPDRPGDHVRPGGVPATARDPRTRRPRWAPAGEHPIAGGG
jgi:hypothetical protein